MSNPGLVIAGHRTVGVGDAPLAPLENDEVLVHTKASGICRLDINWFIGKLTPEYPQALGHEGVGIVEAVGAAVTNLKPGDRVTSIPEYHFSQTHPWMLAQRFVAKATRTARIPDDVEDYQYWISEPVACAVSGVQMSRVALGETVVLSGCGYMGLLLMQVLPTDLTRLTVAIDIDPYRLDLARQYGADVALNAREVDTVAEVMSLTEGKGADLVIEASGKHGTLDPATRMLRVGGRLAIFGFHVGITECDTTAWHLKGLEVTNPSPMMNPNFLQSFQAAVALMNKGTVDQRSLVTHCEDYRDAQPLFETAAEAPGAYIKGALLFD